MRNRFSGSHSLAAGSAIALCLFLVSPLHAADLLAEWNAIETPPPPELSSVTVEGAKTALLLLDMMHDGCMRRPRCIESLPNVKRLHDEARAAGAMIFYSLTGGDNPTPTDIVDTAIAPRDGEWAVARGPDKFMDSDLAERLRTHGITTVIVCGTSAQGSVLGTGSGSAQRGYNVVIPIDCVSSETAFMEQYAVWHMYRGAPARITDKTTVSRSDMITFE